MLQAKVNSGRHIIAWLAWAAFYGFYSYFVAVRTAFLLPDFIGFLCIHILSFYFSVRVAFPWANPQYTRLNRRSGLRMVLVIVAQLIVIPVAVTLVSFLLGALTIGFDQSAVPRVRVLNFFDMVVFLYAGLVFASVYLAFVKIEVQRDRLTDELADLRTQLNEAEQTNLEQSLIPHLYGNLLGTVNDVVQLHPHEAAYIVNIFNQIVRFYASIGPGELVTMGNEIDVCELFMELIAAKVGKQLFVEIEVDDAVRELMVTPMLLMLIFENLDKYGVWDDKRQAIRVFIGLHLGYLTIMARNAVRDVSSSPPFSTKKGLRSIRERLDARKIPYMMHSVKRHGCFSFVLLIDFE